MMNVITMKQSLKQFIAEEFFPGMSSASIDDDTDLITAGILDSLAVLKIISFMEMENDIVIDPEDLDPEKLNSITSIVDLVSKKKDLGQG